ncbi:hypothetical protein NIES267_16680 [Calothrix parasitica NIES-267]|uniref:DUF11 domain-containing protein n=1 Tax=Calothrix parasitica NIES-267 TaxID=1973488 RepID=A0A1Z4LLX2_9CYAN|nr:hypothetical protein NIES267_16680 [Calothrix parasitica NIES-267]
MLNPKLKPPRKNKRNRRNKRIYKYRSLIVAALFSSSSLLPMFPVLAASPAPATVIDNQATGSFTDPNDGNTEVQIESNVVQVEVAEVAGITISQAALPEEAPSGVSGAGANQGNGDINPDDIIYFTYKITNVGNDPTQFFIPDAPSSVNNGSLNGNIEIIEYDPDGASPVDLTSNNITVPNNGDTTGSLLNGIANTNDGSVPAGGSITIRVPVKADSNLSDGNTVTVVMGDTGSNDNSAGTQNQVYALGTKDVYTEDNPDNTTSETNGTPINGDATNRQEASFSQEVVVATAPSTIVSTSVPSCPAAWYSLIDWSTDAPSFANPLNTPVSNTFTKAGIATTISVSPGASGPPKFVSYSPNYVVDTGGNPIIEAGYVDFEFDFSRPVDQVRWYWTDFDVNESGTVYGELNGVRVTPSIEDGPQNTVTINKVVNADGSVTFERPAGETNTTPDENTAVFIGFDVPVDRIVVSHTPRVFSAGGGTNGTIGAGDLQMCADLGDAPDTASNTSSNNYQTLVSDNGPLHIINGPVGLGTLIDDGDTDGFGDGTDDNADASDDVGDDGVVIGGATLQGQSIAPGQSITLDIATAGSGKLNAWIDWNQDGDFDDANEQVATDVTPNNNTISLPVNVPATATGGTTYARFRYSTQTGLTPTGAASDGEVEDYQVEIAATDGNRTLGSPFTCDSTFYITIGPGGGKDQQLYDVDRSGATFIFNPIGPATNTAGGYPVKFDYNALAFNPIDNYIYAYINRSDATSGPYSPGNVVKIGNDGIVHSLGIPTGGTISGSFFAASILSDGTYVIGAGGKFATLDLTTTPPTITNSEATVSGVAFNDFAVDPRNPASISGKEVYGVNENGNQDRLVILDLTTFPPTIKSQAPNPTGFNHNAGSQFVDAFGTLYYRSNSTNSLYKVNTDSSSSDYGKATLITTAPSGGNHDGVSCLFATAMEKEVRDLDGNPLTEPVPAGETVQYIYKIATGNSLDVNGVTFTDDLRSVTGGNPVNGNFLTDSGKVTVSNGSGNITFDNNNQTLQITNLTLPGQNPATPESEALTITAEVTVPKTTTPGTYLNQSFLTNLPAIYPPSIPSDYPPSAPYEDPTPLEVTEPIANNPNVLLVKRITKINDSTTTKNGDDLAIYNQDNSNPYDDNKVDITELPENNGDPKPDTDKWIDTISDTNSTFLIGGINGGKVEPDDELEYTIYYLSTGDSEANSVLLCDRVPENVSFIPTSFNNQTQATGGTQGSNRGIMWFKDGNTESLTNTKDGDAAQYFPPGIEPSTIYPQIQCSGANTNGAVVVNLGNLPNATAPGTPNTSYGYIRFKGKVK